MDMNKLLYDALNKDLVWNGVYDIYSKNNDAQANMRKYAFEHNYNPNGIDHYYHRKSAYEVAQKGLPSGFSMLGSGILKEYRDFFRDAPRMGIINALNENKKDLKNNTIGFIIGSNSKLPAEDNKLLNSYNSATVNAILEALK